MSKYLDRIRSLVTPEHEATQHLAGAVENMVKGVSESSQLYQEAHQKYITAPDDATKDQLDQYKSTRDGAKQAKENGQREGLEEIQQWTRRGANVNAVNGEGRPLLCEILSVTDPERGKNDPTVQYLQKHGADLNGAFQEAAKGLHNEGNRDPNVLRFVDLDDLKAKDGNGKTLLHVASEYGNSQSPGAVWNRYSTLDPQATVTEKPLLSETFNMPDHNGNTPLHLLVSTEQGTADDKAKLVGRLFDNQTTIGADFTIPNAEGKTPADIACENPKTAVALLDGIRGIEEDGKIKLAEQHAGQSFEDFRNTTLDQSIAQASATLSPDVIFRESLEQGKYSLANNILQKGGVSQTIEGLDANGIFVDRDVGDVSTFTLGTHLAWAESKGKDRLATWLKENGAEETTGLKWTQREEDVEKIKEGIRGKIAAVEVESSLAVEIGSTEIASVEALSPSAQVVERLREIQGVESKKDLEKEIQNIAGGSQEAGSVTRLVDKVAESVSSHPELNRDGAGVENTKSVLVEIYDKVGKSPADQTVLYESEQGNLHRTKGWQGAVDEVVHSVAGAKAKARDGAEESVDEKKEEIKAEGPVKEEGKKEKEKENAVDERKDSPSVQVVRDTGSSISQRSNSPEPSSLEERSAKSDHALNDPVKKERGKEESLSFNEAKESIKAEMKKASSDEEKSHDRSMEDVPKGTFAAAAEGLQKAGVTGFRNVNKGESQNPSGGGPADGRSQSKDRQL